MEEVEKVSFLQELHPHLLYEILIRGHLTAADLARVEACCYAFRAAYGMAPYRFKSVPELAAFHLCQVDPLFSAMPSQHRLGLLNRCEGRWKFVLRFLHTTEQAYGCVRTSKGNIQVSTGRYHSLLVFGDGKLYSCGSSLSGVLGQGMDNTQCRFFMPVEIPMQSPVVYVSGSHQHAAFVTRNGEVFTYGDNSSYCCGYSEAGRTVFKPTLVASLKGIPCKQVSTGLSYTVVLTNGGEVYSFGLNAHGQLGHGDTLEKPMPHKVEMLSSCGPVVQIAAGSSHTLAITQDGSLYSFGYGGNFCLGHGDLRSEFSPHLVQTFQQRNLFIIHVAAGEEHSIAIDSNGQVYTWGKGYCGALGHGDESDKPYPEVIEALLDLRAVQVCARKRKTFVLGDDGTVFAFGWMGFGSLGVSERAKSDKILHPHVIESLRSRHVSQISTGLYHTLAVTKKGAVLGFGDNERAQLGLDQCRSCLDPKEIQLFANELSERSLD